MVSGIDNFRLLCKKDDRIANQKLKLNLTRGEYGDRIVLGEFILARYVAREINIKFISLQRR